MATQKDGVVKYKTVEIAPRTEWPKLTIDQLYDCKYKMQERYYNMRGANATFAEQYQRFISEIEAWISRREGEVAAERESQD
jgi:hypothetical protein